MLEAFWGLGSRLRRCYIKYSVVLGTSPRVGTLVGLATGLGRVMSDLAMVEALSLLGTHPLLMRLRC